MIESGNLNNINNYLKYLKIELHIKEGNISINQKELFDNIYIKEKV